MIKGDYDYWGGIQFNLRWDNWRDLKSLWSSLENPFCCFWENKVERRIILRVINNNFDEKHKVIWFYFFSMFFPIFCCIFSLLLVWEVKLL